MGKPEGNKPSRIKELWKTAQNFSDAKLVASLDKIIKKAQPNPPDDQLPKLRRYMIDTSKMPAFVRRKRHRKLDRYESRQNEKQKE